MNTQESLLSPRELASFLSVRPNRIYDLVRGRKLKAVRVGRLLRFRPADVEDFLARNGAVQR